jgi:hypothetical protein
MSCRGPSSSLWCRRRFRPHPSIFYQPALSSFFAILTLALLPVAPCFAYVAAHDPEFDKVPFAEWFSQPDAKWKWTTRISPITLSQHQRLVAHLEIEMPASEFKRSGRGETIFYFQFTDAQGHNYQDHASINLAKLDGSPHSHVVVTTDNAFIVPGDYWVSLAVYCATTGEHSAKREKLHVPPIGGDPLPQTWRHLPPVDFIDASEPPDAWYLPKAAGRLDLPIHASHPVRVEILANLVSTPFGGASNSGDAPIVLPYLKALSEMSGDRVTVHVALVDVERRRTLFRQRDSNLLDWLRLRASLVGMNNGLIDVASLAGSAHNSEFFMNEVARRIAIDESKVARVVIVLSGAMVFSASRNPMLAGSKTAEGGHVIYIRLHSAPSLLYSSNPDLISEINHRANSRKMPVQPAIQPRSSIDELPDMLSIPGFRMFDVATAEEFREALSAVVREISSY